MIADRLLDRGRDPVGMRVLRPLDLVDQAGGTVGLVAAADLVELLPAVADQLAGPADIAGSSAPRLNLRQLEQAELAPCYPLSRGHAAFLAGVGDVWRHHATPQERHGHARPLRH
jgi:hypothetical protein